jgi:hypothetical protein
MALVALAMVGIIAMAGLSIDVGTLYQASAEAQRSADAAALAAARVLSLSGVTGDPTNKSGDWAAACAAATQMAQTVAQQNTVGGAAPPLPTVTFLSTDTSSCTSVGAFGVNPMVTVQVTQPNLPTYFSRIWGRTGNTVSATATAEVFNPSNSGTYASGGEMVPVQPRCVKPWIVPNKDPLNASGCTAATCNSFVSTSTVPPQGSILNGGITYNGKTGVIGENFNLVADCSSTGTCNSTFGLPAPYFVNPPQPNYSSAPYLPPQPNLQYLPGQVLGSPVAVPSCGTTNPYQAAIAGCDQSTPYQCGVLAAGATQPSLVNLNENPSGAGGDTSTAAQCLINQANVQDSINTGVYPYTITAGAGNPLNVSGSVITSSNSIVSLPIYDGNLLATGTQEPSVTIVGFLQVFINSVDGNGNLNVTVLNVAGCGNAVPNGATPVNGTSPVPIRLITPPVTAP